MVTRTRSGQAAALVFTLAACGGAQPPAPKPAEAVSDAPAAGHAAPEQAAEAAPVLSADAPIATDCAPGNDTGICAPSRDTVDRLCGGYPSPDLALVMFAKDSPWTRAYVNRNVEAWYTSGRAGTKAKLVFDEEVIVLRHPKDGGGIVVNGGGAPFDVLRWDGICASLGGEEVTLKRPPAPKRPGIPWQQLEMNVKDALRADAAIAKAETARGKECKGTTGLGMMSATCAKADDRLSAAIVDFVAHGGKAPLPHKPK